MLCYIGSEYVLWWIISRSRKNLNFGKNATIGSQNSILGTTNSAKMGSYISSTDRGQSYLWRLMKLKNPWKKYLNKLTSSRNSFIKILLFMEDYHHTNMDVTSIRQLSGYSSIRQDMGSIRQCKQVNNGTEDKSMDSANWFVKGSQLSIL